MLRKAHSEKIRPDRGSY